MTPSPPDETFWGGRQAATDPILGSWRSREGCRPPNLPRFPEGLPSPGHPQKAPAARAGAFWVGPGGGSPSGKRGGSAGAAAPPPSARILK
eukprot:14542293-Alexandrium_andersonii.AAC.1